MTDMAKEITDWVSETLGDHVDVRYSKFSDADIAAIVRATPGDPVVKLYGSGGGIYRFTYEVILRIAPRKSTDRFDALATLRKLEKAISHHMVPDTDTTYCSHTTRMLPNLLEVAVDGTEYYQMAAETTYYERG